jgi:protein O-mannosyl-transferase
MKMLKQWIRTFCGSTLALVSSVPVVVFLAYANVYDNAFLFDDEFLIVKNQLIRSWEFLPVLFQVNSTAGSGGTDSFYRPMQALMYLLTYKTFGLSTAGFHFLNVSLHAVNAVLIVVLGLRLGLHRAAVFAAAMIWSLHPVHTEAVTYMSATADPLHTLFTLAGMIVLIPKVPGAAVTWTRALTSGAWFALAILTKEAAIVFPALAVACLFAISEKKWHWQTLVKTLPLWALAFAYLVARKTVLNFDESFQFYATQNVYTENVLYRIYTFLATLPAYFGLLLWPQGLHMERSFPVYVNFFVWPVVIGAVIVLVSLALLVRGALRPGKAFAWLALSWGVLWFFAAHVPHMGILIPVNAFFLEHWLYLPSIGLIVGAAHFSVQLLGSKAVVAFAVAASCGLGFLTFKQNQVWRDAITFYTHILKFNPGTARLHNNLAMAYTDRRHLEKAQEHYFKAIEISDTYPQTHHNLGLLLSEQGRVEEAIKHWERAVEMNPRFHHSQAALSEAYRIMGKAELAEEARRKYEEIIRGFDFGKTR